MKAMQVFIILSLLKCHLKICGSLQAYEVKVVLTIAFKDSIQFLLLLVSVQHSCLLG
jgi:hypothetical protein